MLELCAIFFGYSKDEEEKSAALMKSQDKTKKNYLDLLDSSLDEVKKDLVRSKNKKQSSDGRENKNV